MSTLADRQAEYLNKLGQVYDAREARAITSWVIEDIMKLNAVRLSLNRFLILTAYQEELFNTYLERLLKKEPVQYVLGYAEFCGLKFVVTPAVLIPRPETEEIVEIIINENNKQENKNAKHILDIGTGSGCIPITLKTKIQDVIVTAIDISNEALNVARKNAIMNNAEINFNHLDILNYIPEGKFDIIISNPPYIGIDEKERITDNVLLYEPHLALFSVDPLIFYKRIAEIAPKLLKSKGIVYLEVSEYRAREVAVIFSAISNQVEIKNDMSGKQRMVIARS